MPIIFEKETKTFHLYNDKFSYIFYVNEVDLLVHLYYGKRIQNTFDHQTLLTYGFSWSQSYLDKNDVEHWYKNYYNDMCPMELGSHGLNDKRTSSFIIKNKKGQTRTEFLYQSHKIIKGSPQLKTLPHAKNEGETLEIKLKDRFTNVILVLSYTVYDDLAIVLRNSKLIANEDVTLEKANSITLDLFSSEYDMLNFHGDWQLERAIERKKVPDCKNVIQSNFGRSGHEENPAVIICDPNTTESTGEAYGFSFIYSGNFEISTFRNKFYQTRVDVSINQEDFEYDLKPGDEFECPTGVMVYSGTGFNGISNNIHDFVRFHLCTHDSQCYRPIIFNSWEGCFLTFNTQTILDYIDQAATIGSELFVLDDGWFSNGRNEDDNGLGDWFVNKNKIDLHKVIERCHKNNMKFGIWFEPEMINSNSELYRSHKEYALSDADQDFKSLSRHQLMLDTSNPNAVETVFEMMKAILDEYDIDYIKWDHNRYISEIVSNYTKYGEVYHKLVMGTYSLLDKLTSQYPNVFFEGCASGGGRFDLGWLYYVPQIWTSDETDPVQRLWIQYGTSYFYPLSTMGSHISKNPITSYTTKGIIALFGTYGVEMNPTTLNDSEKEEISKISEIYKKYHNDVIQNGDLYRLRNPFETNYMSMISVNKSKTKAMFIHSNFRKEGMYFRFIKLEGLNPKAKYHNDLDNKVYTGEYYMNVGLNLSRWLDEFTTILVILEKVD